MTRFQKILLVAFLTVWVWAAIRPKYPHDWMLENILVVIFVPVIPLLLAAKAEYAKLK